MRCESCSKFTSMDEPEVNSSDFNHDVSDGEVSITGSIDMMRNCAECGGEMKSTTFDVDWTIELPENVNTEEEISVDIDDPEGQESGGGRYKKNMVGYSCHVTVTGTLKDGEEFKVEQDFEDALQASAWDESM